jgi:pyridoxamine 5'-phosphate oxidase
VVDRLRGIIAGLTREHSDEGLDLGDLRADPLEQFELWLGAAIEANLPTPNAMTLATVGDDGQPSARVTLLKGFDERGFVFFSNYDSRKGRELLAHPVAAVVFHWSELGRQVRIEGRVERLGVDESDAYFKSRSYGSRIGAWASPQSTVIADRAELERLVRETEKRFADEEIPLPPHWGGFLLVPQQVEFWKGRRSRLHDRFQYTLQPDGWFVQRLAP